MDAPFNLAVLREKSGGCLGGSTAVLCRMTAFHVAAAVGDVEAEVLKRVATGDQAFDLTADVFGGMCRWRFCPQCLQTDIAEAGVAWWHRAHQLPTSIVCAEHGCSLLWLDVKRHRAHERFILPTDQNGLPVLNMAAIAAENPGLWTALAKLGRDALDDQAEPPSALDVHGALIAGLHQQGLLTRGGNLRRDDFMASFSLRIGRISAPGILRRMDAVVEPLSLVHGIWPGGRSRPTLIRLLLVHWLFGTWRSFLQRCNWERLWGAVSLPEVVAEKAQEPIRSDGLRNKHRDVCRAFQAEFPSASRSAFWRTCPASLRWLKRYDAAWLEFHFPGGGPKGLQHDLFG